MLTRGVKHVECHSLVQLQHLCYAASAATGYLQCSHVVLSMVSSMNTAICLSPSVISDTIATPCSYPSTKSSEMGGAITLVR